MTAFTGARVRLYRWHPHREWGGWFTTMEWDETPVSDERPRGAAVVHQHDDRRPGRRYGAARQRIT